MKKYIVPALAIALIGASIASIAQSAPMDHSSHGMGMNMQGMMGIDSQDRQAMQKKMAEAKTDAERQALMAGHQKQMTGKPGQMDHAGGGMMGRNTGEMQTMRESMQKKMSEAKTDEERQALMAEQQKLMMAKRAQMMSSNASDHDMGAMPGNMAERQQMMQKRMGAGMGMMPM